MTLTHTYTKTYNILDPWAETTPWTTPGHTPMVDTPCAVCGEPLPKNEACYAVTELDQLPDGSLQWVCWRHVQPDDGPIRI